MTGEDLMARSGARWCETHDRWECSAKKPDHHATAIRGLALCKNHAGRSLAVAKALGEANLAAWSTAAKPADAVALDPGTVVLDQLRVAVMRADLYGEMLRWQLEVEDEVGLVGTVYAAGRDGARVETGERARGLAQLEAAERDRVVRFAKTAHDMGIAERHVELEQERASLVTAAFRAALGVLELLPADRDLAVRTFLTSLGAGEVVAGEVDP
ncbi:hypothetical protein GON03_19165 [Nocardioides sp. MAH-18]|uniref:Uncharacterized protein n=1 Tax=Nocardioides agri TaxID=2682843 RepID=A0A6L6XX83_9ACTN|nr:MULTISPECIES: hypothetical protein [unclassified Nocardioides]MBA2952138.1 hypothetical protein [Nocardioides sp. CGMCC 1.13656]MVQ51307.1 hypothetical protein [Nocardioides sp. MAH-18]